MPSRKMKKERFLRFSMKSLFELGIINYTAQYPLCRARHKGYCCARARAHSRRSFLLKRQFTVVRHGFDAVARFEFTQEQLGGERVQHQVLDGPLQRARPKLRIKSLFGNQQSGGAVQFETELLLREAFLQSLKLDFHDAGELFFVEAVKDDNVIHAIQK